MKTVLLTIVLALALGGCGVMDTLSEGFKHSEEVAADLETTVGAKPFVGFNWANGTLVNVTISFEGIPTGRTAAEIAALSRSSIAARFKQQPKNIVISFTLPGQDS